MPVLSLLADPRAYLPCSTEDMHVDHEYREFWLGHFERHFETVMASPSNNTARNPPPASTPAKPTSCTSSTPSAPTPKAGAPSTCSSSIEPACQEKLIAHGIPDPFEKTKARENEACLPLYPRVVAELDSHANEREAARCFRHRRRSLPAISSTSARPGHHQNVRRKIPPRLPRRPQRPQTPLARRSLRRHGHPHPVSPTCHKQALFFLDNAGSDCILGVIPFCRLLAQRGTRVVLAANRLPALNDMTIAELRQWLPRLAALDPVLDQLIREDRITTIDSGGTAPLIDLREISEAVNAEAARTDLLILEGMGRGLESNFEAKFTCDSIKLAMIKEEIVAVRHGGKNFDTVCRFDPV